MTSNISSSRPRSPTPLNLFTASAAASACAATSSPTELQTRTIEAYLQAQGMAAAAGLRKRAVPASSSQPKEQEGSQPDVAASSSEESRAKRAKLSPTPAASSAAAAAASSLSQVGMVPFVDLRRFLTQGAASIKICSRNYDSIPDLIRDLEWAQQMGVRVRSFAMDSNLPYTENDLGKIIGLCSLLEGFESAGRLHPFSEKLLHVLAMVSNRSLTKLNLSGTRVTAPMLKSIGEKFYALTVLELAGSIQSAQDAEGLSHLQGKCLRLREVVLAENSEIRDAHVIPFLQGRTELSNLHLSETQVGNRTFEAVQNNCPRIERLSLTATNITAEAFIGRPLLALKDLKADSCEDISFDAYAKYAGACPSLETLWTNLSNEEIALLRTKFPRIEVDGDIAVDEDE